MVMPIVAVLLCMTERGLGNSLTEFIDGVGESKWSIQIINQTASKPMEGMIDELFDGLEIDTTKIDRAGLDDDLVVLIEDGEVVVSSPLDRIKQTLLLVNSDLYKTGARKLQDIDPPDIIMELSDTVFSLRGYPESNTEKLVLTLVSRQYRIPGAGSRDRDDPDFVPATVPTRRRRGDSNRLRTAGPDTRPRRSRVWRP